MDDKELVREKIENDILLLLPIVKKEYNVPDDIVLNIKNDIDNLVRYSTNTISFFVRDEALYLPIYSFELFNELRKKEEFGTTKDTGVKVENYLDTNTSYYDYINHVIGDGLGVLEYCEESLLHEVMHMCGAKGGYPLQEGITELKTRELAQKYNIKIAAVGYNKEVEIAKRIQEIVGKDVMDKIAFMGLKVGCRYVEDNYSKELAFTIYNIAYKMDELSSNYNKVVRETNDPYEKAKAYEEIDYSEVHNMIDNYIDSRVNIK